MGQHLAYARNPLADGWAPEWASAWGEDEFGVYAEFRVGDVAQKMRWIAPGTFTMGSPEGEAGRLDNEGPAFRAEISRGFWLADTPCTQELWAEVMEGDNPSRFVSWRRPVESVSFERILLFLEQLSTRTSGDGFRLPSEAEWEYAARAGSQRATYAGDVDEKTVGGYVLDQIAWSPRNSHEGFDLEKGVELDQGLAGTRTVALLKANRWGLYDLLGNVWEYCADAYRRYEETRGPVESEHVRDRRVAPLRNDNVVRRGGSWFNGPRYCRAAARSGAHVEIVWSNDGFRLARGQ